MWREGRMINGRVFIDRFSALDDIPHKDRSNALIVLRALHVARRFSCFEVDLRLNSALQEIKRQRWITFLAAAYPWNDVVLTAAGLQALASADV
jgi:hypothetical protein